MKTITAAEANGKFANVLREVAAGETFLVISRGKAVATIAPACTDEAQRSVAKTRLLSRLDAQEATGRREWTRDELYERRS